MQIEAITKARDWTAGMAAYDLVLAKMKSVGAATLPAEPSAKSNKSKRKQPEAPSGPPVPVADKSASAEPNGTSQSKKGKRKKKDKALSAATDASTISSAANNSMASPTATAGLTVAPVAIVPDVAEAKPQAIRARGRHIGRYHKTTAAKKAGAYSRSDLAAILGVDSLPAAAVAPITVAAAATQPASSDEQVSCPGSIIGA